MKETMQVIIEVIKNLNILIEMYNRQKHAINRIVFAKSIFFKCHNK